MSAALARRDEGCASDLAMDRWLLGEIPGSDEGRRLERHVRACPGCAARFQALRSLYGNRPAPKAEAPLPPLSAPPPVLPPEHAAVLQVVILRDGLLVGTEVFTAGRYTVGGDASCALRLDDLVPLHAAVSLSGARVALEAAGGPVFVNGFRATACELRPIDEVAVGPYVLRARVISERWQRPALEVVHDEPPVVPAAAPVAYALKLELFWGDTRLDVQVVDSTAELDELGVTSVERIDGGWALDGLRVAHGESARFHVGHLVCVATPVPLEAPVAARSPREWPWPVVALATVLFSAVIGLGLYGERLEPADFVPKPVDPAIVHVVMKPKPAPKAPAAPKTPSKPATAHAPPKRQPPRLPLPPALVQPNLVRDLFAKVDAGKAAGRPGKRPPLLAGIGAGLPAPSASPAFHGDAFAWGIGATGARDAGSMKTRDIGKGGVKGTVAVDRARPLNVGASSLSRDEISKVINAHLSDVQGCYERAMARSGGFGGRMMLEWRIAPAGDVTVARIKQTDVKNAAFGSCVLERLKTWKFPRAPGPSEVTFPVLLDHHDF
ncbi:MAG: AgmX/PglI C-terminal domain-containing protein [Myxococcaceae bacterium]|nr:AgmX/PglI C-terminal domain-containing protein [Myxococcaceae bacterium]